MTYDISVGREGLMIRDVEGRLLVWASAQDFIAAAEQCRLRYNATKHTATERVSPPGDDRSAA